MKTYQTKINGSFIRVRCRLKTIAVEYFRQFDKHIKAKDVKEINCYNSDILTIE